MKKRKKIVLIIVLMVLVFAAALYYQTQRDSNDCDAIACASDGKCVAPNDAVVNCERLRQNSTKTDWLGKE